MLPKENRLKKEKDIGRVIQKGKGFKEDFLILKVIQNNLDKTRFGFIVSKKVSPKATTRNKIKRRISGLVKSRMNSFQKGIDVMLITLPGLETKDFWEIEETLNKLFKKISKV